jgi:hypothetical protein
MAHHYRQIHELSECSCRELHGESVSDLLFVLEPVGGVEIDLGCVPQSILDGVIGGAK